MLTCHDIIGEVACRKIHSEGFACVRTVPEHTTDPDFRRTPSRQQPQNRLGSAPHVSRAQLLPPSISRPRPSLSTPNSACQVPASCARTPWQAWNLCVPWHRSRCPFRGISCRDFPLLATAVVLGPTLSHDLSEFFQKKSLTKLF